MSQYLRRFVLIALSSALLSCALIPAASAQSGAPDIRDGGPQDWSHRHLIYSNPDTRDEAARKGTVAFEQWKQKNKDPRFAQQVAKKAKLRATQRKHRVLAPADAVVQAERPEPARGCIGSSPRLEQRAGGRQRRRAIRASFRRNTAPLHGNGLRQRFRRLHDGFGRRHELRHGTFANSDRELSRRNPAERMGLVITNTGSPAARSHRDSTTLESGPEFPGRGHDHRQCDQPRERNRPQRGTAGVTATSAGAVCNGHRDSPGSTGTNRRLRQLSQVHLERHGQSSSPGQPQR